MRIRKRSSPAPWATIGAENSTPENSGEASSTGSSCEAEGASPVISTVRSRKVSSLR